MSKLSSVLGSLIAICATTAFAFSVDVNTVSNFPESFHKLALLPTVGPKDFDTSWADGVIGQKFSARKIVIIPAPIVRQAMFDLEISELTDENLSRLAEKLKVDAFVLATIDVAETQTGATHGALIGKIGMVHQDHRQVGVVQLSVIAADSGKVLMHGVGHGQSEVRSERGVVGRLFDQILDRAFTPVFFQKYRQ